MLCSIVNIFKGLALGLLFGFAARSASRFAFVFAIVALFQIAFFSLYSIEFFISLYLYPFLFNDYLKFERSFLNELLVLMAFQLLELNFMEQFSNEINESMLRHDETPPTIGVQRLIKH